MTVPTVPPRPARPEPSKPTERWRWRDGLLLGRVRGFPVLLAPSWVIIAALITLGYGELATDAVPGLGRGAGHLVGLAFAVLFAASILLHELGHAFAADALGLRVRKVVIFLLGGVSEIDPARRPRDEFLVAAAGPAVSFALAAGLWAALPAADSDTVPGLLIRLLLWSNIAVALFNVLPGLPLDGGRVLRAGVWGATGSRSRATRVGAWGGRVLAAGLLVGALALALDGRGATLLMASAVVLAGFLWLSAGASLRAAAVESGIDALAVGPLIRSAIWAPAGTALADAVATARHYGAEAIVVTDGAGAPSAIVDEEQLARLPAPHWPHVPVHAVAAPIAPAAVLSDALTGDDLLTAMRAAPAAAYLVVGRGREPLGVLRAVDVARAIHRPRRTAENG